MNYVIIAVIVIIILVVIIYKILAASHRKWLLEQSPVGCWVQDSSDATVKIQFNGEQNKNGGTYYKITKAGTNEYREFGSWQSNMTSLSILVMASEQPEQYPIGKEFNCMIQYTGPDEIYISDGVNRYDFKRGNDQIAEEFEIMKKNTEHPASRDRS